MGEEGAMEGEEIVMTPGEEALPSKPADKNRELVKKMLDGCLKHGLAALCKEKPEEPIKWLAHWLLDNNPNQPRVRNCTRAAPPHHPPLPLAPSGCPGLTRSAHSRAVRHPRAPKGGRAALCRSGRVRLVHPCAGVWAKGVLRGVLTLARCSPGDEARESAA